MTVVHKYLGCSILFSIPWSIQSGHHSSELMPHEVTSPRPPPPTKQTEAATGRSTPMPSKDAYTNQVATALKLKYHHFDENCPQWQHQKLSNWLLFQFSQWQTFLSKSFEWMNRLHRHHRNTACILIKLSLKFITQSQTDNKSALLQAMAWCCQATSQWWPWLMWPYYITKPQRVKKSIEFFKIGMKLCKLNSSKLVWNYVNYHFLNIIVYTNSINFNDKK